MIFTYTFINNFVLTPGPFQSILYGYSSLGTTLTIDSITINSIPILSSSDTVFVTNTSGINTNVINGTISGPTVINSGQSLNISIKNTGANAANIYFQNSEGYSLISFASTIFYPGLTGATGATGYTGGTGDSIVSSTTALYTTPGTYTISIASNVKRIDFILVAGGGGGGFYPFNSSNYGRGGGAGAIGIFSYINTSALTINASVGSGGLGASVIYPSPAQGDTGNPTYVTINSVTSQVTGGIGGTSTNSGAGGAGGTAIPSNAFIYSATGTSGSDSGGGINYMFTSYGNGGNGNSNNNPTANTTGGNGFMRITTYI
jgi:hypothetical protein